MAKATNTAGKINKVAISTLDLNHPFKAYIIIVFFVFSLISSFIKSLVNFYFFIALSSTIPFIASAIQPVIGDFVLL